MQPWFVYMVEASDATIYTGCTTDPVRRVHEHNHTKAGARCLRGKRPVTLLWCMGVPEGKVPAHRLEWWLKRHPATWKRKLTRGEVDIQEKATSLGCGTLYR